MIVHFLMERNQRFLVLLCCENEKENDNFCAFVIKSKRSLLNYRRCLKLNALKHSSTKIWNKPSEQCMCMCRFFLSQSISTYDLLIYLTKMVNKNINDKNISWLVNQKKSNNQWHQIYSIPIITITENSIVRIYSLETKIKVLT